jgi:excisionase family DNA binding protein
MSLRRLLTVGETAQRLGFKERTIRRWLSLRKITFIKIGTAVRIPEAEIRRIVRKGRVRKLSPKSLDWLSAMHVQQCRGSRKEKT